MVLNVREGHNRLDVVDAHATTLNGTGTFSFVTEEDPGGRSVSLHFTSPPLAA